MFKREILQTNNKYNGLSYSITNTWKTSNSVNKSVFKTISCSCRYVEVVSINTEQNFLQWLLLFMKYQRKHITFLLDLVKLIFFKVRKFTLLLLFISTLHRRNRKFFPFCEVLPPLLQSLQANWYLKNRDRNLDEQYKLLLDVYRLLNK